MAEGNASGPRLSVKNLRLPILSFKLGKMFQTASETIDIRVEDDPKVTTDLLVHTYGFRLRQGWSINNGTTKFYWTVHIDYRQITLCSYYHSRETATWSWAVNWPTPLTGERDVAFELNDNYLSEPSEWPLAKVALNSDTIVTVVLDTSWAGRYMTEISQLLAGCERLEVPPLESTTWWP